MSPPRRGRRIALAVVAFTLLGIGTSAVVLQERIRVQYYLYRLHATPAELGGSLQEPDGTAEKKAALEFLGRAEGRQALFRPYFETALGELEILKDTPAIESFFWVEDAAETPLKTGRLEWGPELIGLRPEAEKVVPDPETFLALSDHLFALEGIELTIAEHPELRFQFLRGSEAFDSAWMPGVYFKFAQHVENQDLFVCRVRRAERIAARILIENPEAEHAIEALVRVGYRGEELIKALEEQIDELDAIILEHEKREALRPTGDRHQLHPAVSTRRAAIKALESLGQPFPEERWRRPFDEAAEFFAEWKRHQRRKEELDERTRQEIE